MTTMTTTRSGYTQVNLLPPETKELQKTRRQTVLIVAVGVAVLAVLLLFSFIQGAKVSGLQDKLDAQDATNATLQAQTAKLQPYEAMREAVTTEQQLVDTALAGDVSWSDLLHRLAAVIPAKMWINTLSATTNTGQAATTAPSTTVPSSVIGSLTFQGEAMDTDTLSQWLIDLGKVPGWVNPWLSSAQKGSVGSTTVYSFSSSVDLSKGVVSKRGGHR